MINMSYTSISDQETKKFGKELAQNLHGGDVICLYGELGAGKTTLVKGIAEGLIINEDITSPTFTLMNIYKLPPSRSRGDEPLAHTLVHIDTYRLKDEKELLEIGVEDYLGKPDTICIIEWPEKIEGLLKDKKKIEIKIEHAEKKQRKIFTQNL
jgi:tRNA threonylcarbamoyladenosine biosynthesis protein TsaE